MNSSSRRVFFRYMAILGLATWGVTPLLAKGTKEKLIYQETPKDGKKCADCLHFLPETNECKVVEGAISPDGWCMMYFKDTRKKS
ncbi:iron oxidase oxidoreductase [Sulfurimonas sp.]|uniref:iron oxidase oxidoreductase n=1 Tax=Sulfurimonas sp. TaxID=2022749 RepID=UPI0025D7A6AE|nr:iron oxidase oxidoreductase [Sulfurimonas sp.]MBW6489544.1 iron oxidase oxidoreductase [Sulfurimonas sp.]